MVNDAGICPFWDFGTMPEEIWDQVLDVNLQAVSEVMIEQGIAGRIINIGLISSIVGGKQRLTTAPARPGSIF